MMVRRLFWFLIGAGIAVFVYTKVRQYTKKASPDAIGQRVANTASGISGSAREFVDRLRAGMTEREDEIRETLNMPDSRSPR
jgi:hypothetical protein